MTPVVEKYLLDLRMALSGMTLAEREEIVDEIRAHTEERSIQSGMTVEEILRRLGPAVELARDYNNGALLRRASRSRSPWFILRTTYYWARTGIQGLILFVLAFVGYVAGGAFMLCAFLKPLFPDQIGLWIGSSGVIFGVPASTEGSTEILGPWFTQVALVMGIGFLIGTTVAVRALLPKLKKSQHLARGVRETELIA